MATTLRIDIENATKPGVQEVKRDLGSIAGEAHKVEKALDATSDSARRLDESFDVDAAMEISHLKGVVGDLQKQLQYAADDADQLRIEMDDLNDELRASSKSAKDAAGSLKTMGDKGKDSFKNGLIPNVIGFNQALELGKKIIGGVSQSINALADDGSPAFFELKSSIDEAYRSLLKLADDPEIQSFAKDLSTGIRRDAIPAMQDMSLALGESYRYWSIGTTAIKEYFGYAQTGAAKLQIQQQRSLSDRKEEIAAEREKLMVDDKLGELRTKINSEMEMQRMAALRDEKQIKSLIEEETDAMRENERAGKATAKSREESLKRVEVLERRLAELPQERADAEIKAQTDIANARQQELEDWKKIVAESAQAAADAKKLADSAKADQAREQIDQLKAAIAEAKSILNPQQSAVDGMRDQVSRGDIAKDLIAKRRKDARDKFIGENRDKVDLDGRAMGDTSAERARNQQEINRKIRKAEADAERAFRRQAATGGLDQNEIREAQDARILKGAEGRGLKGTKVFDALKEQLAESRKAAQEFQQQQADIGRLQVATASPQDQRRFDAMRNRAINQAGGNVPGLDDRVLQDFARSSGQGNQTLEKFATTATQALGQVTQQQSATDVRINSLEQQIALLIGAGANSAARARAQRGSR